MTRWLEHLGESLWPIPAIAAVMAFGGAKGLVALDRLIAADREAWYLFGGEAGSAREILSTISSSMITLMTLVFTITIVVLQVASNQFSPRVLRTFLQDRVTKAAAGTFIGTFVFAMTLLQDVRDRSDGGPGFVPALSTTVAFVLVLASVAVFISYVDHMAHAIRAVTIIKRISAETRRSIDMMFPEGGVDDPAPVQGPTGPPAIVVPHDGRGGILSAVDDARLLELARASDAVIALVPLPGDFVPQGAPLFRIWGGELDHAALRRTAFVAAERTLHQDPAFGFRQLVDIAERALSPGTNDPSTAVQVLDELHDLLRQLAGRPCPPDVRLDETGVPRLVLPRPAWADYVRLALDEIRQYGSGSILVVRRMRALIEDCLAVATPERRACLEKQLHLLDETTREEMPVASDRRQARRPSPQGQGRE